MLADAEVGMALGRTQVTKPGLASNACEQPDQPLDSQSASGTFS